MPSEISVSYEFGSYRLDVAKRLLVKDGKSLPLAPKTFDLLLLLVTSQGRVLTRSGLISALWPDTFVEEANLSFQISALRRTLGHDGLEWIETVPKYGYRFTGTVTEVGDTPPVTHGAIAPVHELALDAHPRQTEETLTGSDALVQNRSVPVAPSAGRLRGLARPLFGIVMTLAAVTIAVIHFRETPPEQRAVRFNIVPSEKVNYVSPVVSPDGKWLALIGLTPDGGRRLWVRALGSLKADPLPGTELVDAAFWSPDSRFVAFFAGGKLKTISLHGPPETVCEAPGGGGAGSWSRKGLILFQTRAHPELFHVAASGGVAEPVTALDPLRQETGHYAPQFLPDSSHFIYFVRSRQTADIGIYVGSLDSKESKHLLNSNGNAVYAESGDGRGYLLFTAGTTLMRQAFNPSSLRLTGEPFPVVQQVLVTLASGLNRGTFSASQNGVLAYRTGTELPASELVWFNRAGQRLGLVGEPADYSNPALSPDEKKLAVSRVDPQRGTRDLWLFHLEHGTSSRVTFDPADETCPSWAPDSSRIAYSASSKGVFDIYQKVVTSTSRSRALFESNENKIVQSWSSDGRFIVFRTTSGKSWKLSMDGPQRLKTPLGEGRVQISTSAEVSPDGRWLAYQVDEPNRSEVYVERLSPPGGEWQVSTSGGIEPHWRQDGKELYYISDNKLMAVDVKTDSPMFGTTTPKALFELKLDTVARRSRYQVAANGRKFLVNTPLEAPSLIAVVVNWTADMNP